MSLNEVHQIRFFFKYFLFEKMLSAFGDRFCEVAGLLP